MSGDTLYRKVGNKYVPAGIHSDVDIYPGIWLVQKRKNSTSMQSLHVGDLPTISSLIEVVQARMIGEIVVKKFSSMVQAGELEIYERALAQLEWDIADAIIEYLNEGREKAVKSGYDSLKQEGMKQANDTMAEILDPSQKHTWHNQPTSRLYRLLDDIQEVGHQKVGTHEFVWYISELKRLLKANGFDLTNMSIGGLVVNPEADE
jgi:hypothetical protein